MNAESESDGVDLDGRCPVCDGQGQVFLNEEPTFCLPCEGTGLRYPDMSPPPPGDAP